MLTVKVNRDQQNARSCSYQVQNEEQRTVLEVLEDIQWNQDPTLAFRFSCRIGLCATCIMLVNGKPAKSCLQKAVQGEEGILELSPLPKGEHCKDLVLKMT